MNFFIFILLISYALGAVPFGKIVGFYNKIDIAKAGSGNIGFTNSLRVMGYKPALFVLLGDIMKGFIPTFYAISHFTFKATLLVGLISVLGHIFSPYLKLKGGKGVATTIGVSLALNFKITIFVIIFWILIFIFKKTASLASLFSVFFLVLLSLFLDKRLFYFYLLLFFIILFTHRKNIRDILDKKERVF